MPCFEWIRALGCVAIVLLHVYVTLEIASDPSQLMSARLVVDRILGIVLGRWAVPCFFMVTGALLLDPAKNVGLDRIKRYIFRMLFVLATIGLAFCLMESVVTHGELTLAVVGEAVRNLICGQSWDHLWYVYTLLFMYCFIPLLKSFVSHAGRRELVWAILAGSGVVFGFWAALLVIGYETTCPLRVGMALLYCLIGWYVWTYLQLNVRWMVLGVASLAAVLLATSFGYPELCLPEYGVVAPYGVFVFLLFKRYASTPVEQYPLVQALADRSFGIFVLHPLFLHVAVRVAGPLLDVPVLYEALAFLGALVGSALLVDVLRRLPGFKTAL